MTVRLAKVAARGAASADIDNRSRHLTCALVNNMPDGAFDSTERQYLGLLEDGSGPKGIEVFRYTMPGVPRGEQTSKRIAEVYFPLTDIYLDPPDLLIVTGSNPIETHIQDELYWDDLVELLSWARGHVTSTLLSCLSAHAALTVFDDVTRIRLLTKCTGVFSQQVEDSHPLTAGLESEILLPHSRWNTVPREALERVGYNVVIHSETTGWSVATREEGGRQIVLVQGHPEYDPSSLLREYRRDAGRYANRERDDLPYLPYHCVSVEDWEPLERMHHEIIQGDRNPARIDEFPFDDVGARAPWPWRSMAQRFYANWLNNVLGEGPTMPDETIAIDDGQADDTQVGMPDETIAIHAGRVDGTRAGMHDETIAIHAGYQADGTRAVAVPIYMTVANDFIDAEHANSIMDLTIPGFHYNRINNPTNDVLEKRITALEDGTATLVVASGMAAVSYAILTVATAGSNFVAAPQLYGATYTYFAHVLSTLGIEARFAANDQAESIGALIDERTCCVFVESIGNPAGNVVDLEAVADVAHRAGVPLIVDNTVATPIMLKPLHHGADVVVHSLTKFIGGHGTTLGGAIVDGGSFPWADHAERFPTFNQPEVAFHDVVFARDFPERPFVVRARSIQLRNTGATLSPFNSFQILQGLETLALRLERHEANARIIAAYLANDPRVEWVSFAGFADNPYQPLVQKYLKGRVPSIITFGVTGGYEAGLAFFDSVQLFKRLLNLGDAKSLVIHPASTTHRQLSESELIAVGIRPETIRLSIGLEHVDDLIDDIDQALTKATG
ncbi:MAG: homoserine O-succinyltransferase [Acidimicrobiales bacterium]